MAKRNASRNSGKRTPQKASSLAVNTSKKMDRDSVVAGCVPRKNRRPRARNPPASSPASPEKSKSPRSPGRPRVRVSSPSSKRKKVSRARREISSQVTAERSAGLKRSAGGPSRPATATAGFTDSTITSPAKKIRSKRDKQARAASPRRSDVKDENAKKLNDKLNSKLNTVTNGRVAKKKARRVRFKTAPRAPINSTQKIIHHYNNRRRNPVRPASSLASPRLSRHAGAVAVERLLEGQIDVYGTHLPVRRSARLTPSRASSPARSMIFSPMRGECEATPGREEWYADTLPAEVFAPGGGTQKKEEEYDEWVDGAAATPTPRPEYLTSPRVQWTPRSPALHRGAVA